MKVTDKRRYKISSTIYGYCTCGRELNKDRNKTGDKCPMCQSKIDWGTDDDVKDMGF